MAFLLIRALLRKFGTKHPLSACAPYPLGILRGTEYLRPTVLTKETDKTA